MRECLKKRIRIGTKLLGIVILTGMLVLLIKKDKEEFPKQVVEPQQKPQVQTEQAKFQQVTWVITNAYIVEYKENSLRIFYEGREMNYTYIQTQADVIDLNGQICDITFRAGEIIKIVCKTEKISGKLVMCYEQMLELEGKGQFSFKENCRGYQLFEELRTANKSELPIGYDYADFILDDGQICAFLISRREAMESIRVALKTSDFNSLYHDEVVLKSCEEMTMTYGAYDARKQLVISAGEEFTLSGHSKYLSGDRVELASAVNTGQIQVVSIDRSQGHPAYSGKLEILSTSDGLILINEVLLEEYLYSVVPSEMPASYPMEALKAQAVCARTYAYRYLEYPGYGELGAHVDDSVGYQVYNNIAESADSTEAVRQTTGTLLLYEEEPADIYYYSTSCGFGTDAGIWSADAHSRTPYMKARHITDGEKQESTGVPSVISEDDFRNYIIQTDANAFENEEPWFRWTYEITKLDEEILYKKLLQRYEANPEKILTYTGEGEPTKDEKSFVSRRPRKIKKVYDIQCLKRRDGGVMDVLLITTDRGIYKIFSEYNIRAVLNQGGEVVRQDDSTVPNITLLPSAYFVIDTIKKGEKVVGYKLIGGGYGHGAGMSQNAAKVMGIEGMSYEEILDFFFRDCHILKLY